MRKSKIKLQTQISILTVDDDPIITSTIKNYFERSGYSVDIENDPVSAIERVRDGNYDIMLLDFLMSPICGDQVVSEIRKFNKDLFIVLLTGHKSMAPPVKTIRQLDIQGYFMHIRRSVLYEVVVETLRKYDYTDPLLLYLTDVIINKDPLQNCRYCGKLSDWDGLPDSKCLSKQPVGVGLPIGDLTSQLFSNIFLNKLDRFVTYDLGFKHYGRYVDDLWLIDESKEKLQDAIVKISSFLSDIGMTLHPKKIRLHPCTDKISFLGAVCAPRCRHASRRTTKKFSIKLHKMEQMLLSSENSDGVLNLNDITACLNSYLGYLGHFSSDKYVCKMLKNSPLLHNFLIHRTPNARYGKIKPNK
jgi:CheY-like chemotaxis protein